MSDARALAVLLPLIVAWLAIGAGVARRFARPVLTDDQEFLVGGVFVIAALLWPVVLLIAGLHALGTWAKTPSRWEER